MSISTYFKPSIHQNSPEILGVKASFDIVAESNKKLFHTSLRASPLFSRQRWRQLKCAVVNNGKF
jgi:hypothetical protein